MAARVEVDTSGDPRGKYRGAMLGALVGDAFGAGFEFRGPVSRAAIDRHLADNSALHYTDDTHMMLGLAESLLAGPGFDGPHLARRFTERFFEEPWRGYGASPPKIFQQIREGASWDQPARTLFGAGGSFGNGAAMRVAPAALFASPDLDAVAELARLQSLVTHTHPLGYEGAILIACAVAHLLQRDASALLNVDDLLGAVGWRLAEPTYQEKLSEIAALLPDASPDIVAARLGNVVVAHLSAPAAVYAFLRSPRAFVETICYAVSLGGDTDTIACMAGALAGAHLGEGAIPDQLLGRVEGVDYVRSLADQLYDLVTAH